MKNGFDLERRSAIRLNEELSVSLKFSDSDIKYKAFTRNIAKDGLCLKVDLPKETISRDVSLNVDIPEIQKSLNLDAQIVWQDCQDFKNVRGLGVRFLNAPNFAKNSLQEYIFKKLNILDKPENVKLLEKRDVYFELSEKERRSLNMLNAIRRNGPIAKAEIAKLINLNIGTISNYVEDYIRKQIVFDKGFDISSGGRRPSLLELNENFSYTIGIDIKDFITACLLDAKGNIINKLKQELKDNGHFKEVLALVDELIATSKIDNNLIRGIGLSYGSKINSYNGLVDNLEDKFRLPVFVLSSSTACVFAEYWANEDLAHLKNIVFLSADDFSLGLILNRELYFSGQNNFSKPANLNKIYSKDISVNLPSKDTARDLLFLKVVNIIDVLNPDLIIIGNGGCNLNDKINSIKEKINASFEAFKFDKIISCSFADYTTSIGAASIVAREVFIQS